MDVWGAVLVLARRFYLAVPLAGLTLLLGYTFAHKVAPEYHATASLVLIGPTAPQTDTPAPVNPYVTSLGTGTTASVLQIDVYNAPSVNQVEAAGNSTNYTVAADARSPILTITATAASPQRAIATATQLVSIIQNDLAALQKPYTTDKAYQITALAAGGSALATADTSSRTKALAIVVGIAIVVTTLVTLLTDSILNSRKRKPRKLAWDASTLNEPPAEQRTTVVRS